MNPGLKLSLRITLSMLVFAALVFLPAGTWRYWEGWAFLAVWFLPGLSAFVYFYKHEPELVRRRTQIREEVKEQRIIMRIIYAIFLVAFLIPGLDFRFHWSREWGGVPLWLQIVSLALVLTSFLLTIWVMYVNRFAARTIQVEAGQTVVSSGPYGCVRHPMYLGILIMMLFTPLALASYVALPFFAMVVPALAARLLNEESVLRKELPGYVEYCERTRHRLIPFVW